MPQLEWRKDEFGADRRALYLGGLYVGSVIQWSRRAAQPWRGWAMTDPDGVETGWFDTEEDARLSVIAAVNAALSKD